MDSQIMDALGRADVGLKLPELCRELALSSELFYCYSAKFCGMDVQYEGTRGM
jgi:putative transposase